MGVIHTLDLHTAQRIAAGEVVERPASVVKELAENSLDAGADRLTISIEQGGKKSIRMTDNGSGMSAEDAVMAFEQHATSKIDNIADLDHLLTMGFRGEALPTIAAVAKVTLITRRPEDSRGTKLVLEGGRMTERAEVNCNPGTTIDVQDLFYNTPARFKFLKQDQSEALKITEVVQELALSRPDVSIFLESQGREVLHTPGDNRLLSAIYAVFGQSLAKAMVPVIPAENQMVRCEGYLALPEEARKSRNLQYFFVNGRPIKSPVLVRALEDAYKSTIMTGRFPAAVLKIELPLNLVDVNVHPRKLEVRFWNDSEVFKAVYEQVQNSLFTALRPPQTEAASFGSEAPLGTDASGGVATTDADDDDESIRSTETNAQTEKRPDFSRSADKTYLQFDLGPQLSHVGESQEMYASEEQSALAPETQGAQGAPGTSGVVKCSLETRDNPEQLSFVEKTETGTGVGAAVLAALRQARYAGELFRTYLLFEYEDDVLVIDQHAAHEKILFEQAVAQYQKTRQIRSQVLLEPTRMEISPADELFIEEHQEEIAAFGFVIDSFGPGIVLIRSVPIGREMVDPAKALRYLLDEAQDKGIDQVKGESDLVYHLLATSSCKAAVKAHDDLKPVEIEALRDQLLTLDNPFHCPHGRPVIIVVKRTDLEKLFKRIV